MKSKKLESLKLLYLLIFVLGIILVAPTHLFSPPYFMPLRFPHYLEMMPAFLGVSWPMSFEIYHYILYVLTSILSLNVLGIVFYPKLKKLAIFSSMIGTFLFSLIILFFFFIFLNVNVSTSIVYGIYFVILLIVDLLTLKALIKERKGASRGWF